MLIFGAGVDVATDNFLFMAGPSPDRRGYCQGFWSVCTVADPRTKNRPRRRLGLEGYTASARTVWSLRGLIGDRIRFGMAKAPSGR